MCQVCKSTMAWGTLPCTWASREKKVLFQAMVSGRLVTLLQVEPGKWSNVSGALDIEARSKIGKLLFGQHLHEVATERSDTTAAEDALQFARPADGKISKDNFGTAVNATVVAITGYAGSDKIPERRKVPSF